MLATWYSSGGRAAASAGCVVRQQPGAKLRLSVRSSRRLRGGTVTAAVTPGTGASTTTQAQEAAGSSGAKAQQRTLLQSLKDNVAAGIIKSLDIKDKQPETVDSLEPDEIKKCIQYGAWAWAAYEKVTDRARAKVESVTGTCGPTNPLLDNSLVILSGSSPMRMMQKTDTQALVGLLDDQKGGVELVVAFRGSEKKADDWLVDFYIDFTTVSNLVPDITDKKVEIHAGFTTSANDFLKDKTKLYYGARDTTECDRDNYGKAKDKKQKNLKLSDAEARALELSDVKSLKQLATDMAAKTGKKITKVVCCGHSLGGALATLTAFWCKKVGWPDLEVEYYSFGSPRVGNEAFAKLWDEAVLNKNPARAFRVMHRQDPVAGVPAANIPIPLPGDKFDKPYHHVGGGVVLCQPGKNPLVGSEGNPKCWPARAFNVTNGYQAQKRSRPISLANKVASDHDIDMYVCALIDALKNHHSNSSGPLSG